MNPMKYTNLSQYSIPRDMTIVIEHSEKAGRVGPYVLKPGEDVTIEPNENGRIENWLPDTSAPFAHGEEDAWVMSKDHLLSVRNMRAFTRPQRDGIIKKSRTIEGLNVSFVPITKERI